MNARLLAATLLALAFAAIGWGPAARAANGEGAQKTVVFFGDSLTFGYGLAEPATESFPALIQKKLTDAHRPWRVVNAGLSGETTSAGLRRVEWIMRQPFDVIVISLGGNDGLRGIAPPVTRANLQGIIDRVRAKYPAAKILLTGMQIPPSLGLDYALAFEEIYPALAKKNHVALVPFLLEGVGGSSRLNQSDGIHPTAEGHAIVAETVWKYLEPLL
jgi:acyl-CoA thioesterase-1